MLSTAFSSLLVALISTQAVNAWFRVACTQPLVQERLDPIVNPGQTPSQHVHTVHGAQNFAANSTYDTLRRSGCTSCLVKEDLSNYWFPKLYFKDPNGGKYTEVSNGGLLIYYQNRGDGDVKNGGKGIKAFPAGFKMVSGNPKLRSKKYTEGEGSQGELAERAIQWSCLRYGSGNNGYDGHGFPYSDCEAGLNSRIHMPACWDGQNIDSADHKSHVAFLSGLDNGRCPDTHPVYLMKLFYEVTWNVHEFAGRWDGRNWPFVYATGDPTGYSWHADFQNGWDTNALQNAIDQCDNPHDDTGYGKTEACRFLTVDQAANAQTCKTQPSTGEQVTGTLDVLPGCNPIQAGPGDATMYGDSNCPGH